MSRADQRLKQVYWNVRLLGLPEPLRDLWTFVLTALVVVSLAQTNSLATSINRSLCVFRGDLEQRAANGRAFLAAHPNGIAGIPASAIRVSLDGQQRTIRALSGLDCD